MKYTVAVNEKKRTVTVDLGGYKGVARCCPTDHFDLTVGVELALERARVAKREAEAPKVSSMSVMELVKALEKALPKGQMVVVGNGDKMTEAHKQWLRSIIGGCTCSCHCDDDDEVDEEAIYDEGYDSVQIRKILRNEYLLSTKKAALLSARRRSRSRSRRRSICSST